MESNKIEVNKINNFEFKMVGKGYKPKTKRTQSNNLFCNWNNIANKTDLDKILDKVYIKHISEKLV